MTVTRVCVFVYACVCVCVCVCVRERYVHERERERERERKRVCTRCPHCENNTSPKIRLSQGTIFEPIHHLIS